MPAGLACAGILVSTATGCGSSAPPPFALSCKLQVLSAHFIRAAVTVHNNTGNHARPIIYGPALRFVTHEYPLLSTKFVVVDSAKAQRTTYIGFVVPRIKANGTAHLLLRFLQPPRPVSVLVTGVPHVKQADLQNEDCVIRQHR